MQRTYLDYAATTPLDPAAAKAMQPYLSEVFGNPSSIHGFGRQARAALDDARDQVARCLGARAEEILFTSCGTESNNTVLQGVLEANAGRGHVITTAIEHHAVLDCCAHLAARGMQTTLLPVDENGLVDPEDVRRAITRDTILVSVMYANNEVGTAEPVAEIGRLCREAGVLFHTDAVQAAGLLPLDVNALSVDFLSLSGHKFYGPKGVGVLYARRGAPWASLLYGGGQERGRRAGTENVAGIVGLAAALDHAEAMRQTEAERLTRLRDRLIAAIVGRIEHCRLNGHPTLRLANNANVSIEGVEAEPVLLNLDLAGIAASGGSACTAGSLEPSHVLRALGVPEDAIRGGIRFSLGRSTTEADVDATAEALADIVARLRSMASFAAPRPAPAGACGPDCDCYTM